MHSQVRTNEDQLERVLHASLTDDSIDLPPPPHVANEVTRLTRAELDDDTKVAANSAELAKLIQRDVALAGQVMRVANSALYARRTPVVTLRDTQHHLRRGCAEPGVHVHLLPRGDERTLA
jgi:HD-like signal output (HDOD) protein